MLNFLSRAKSFFFDRWKNIIQREKLTERDVSHFYPLSPINKIKDEDGKIYFNALSWALNNRKDENIKNIALTGPYGSGKSSILQSFQKINKNNKLHFMNISLATFKEELEKNEEADKQDNDEELLRLLELSIVQQLFYREKYHVLPDSRLKKIRKFKWWELLIETVAGFLFFISFFIIIKPGFLTDIFTSPLDNSSIDEQAMFERIFKTVKNVFLPNTSNIVITCLSLLFIIIGIIFIIWKSIRIFHNLKINTLNINNAEIKFNSEINRSVLNHNLEEILYFFEATPYNVVIIEDLDRFQKTEIFTKLREINMLINNSKKINKYVVFIYAIRDDMFSDKDRIKFFDFIIPVIPVINLSNSNQILQKGIKPIADTVSDMLIDDISLFIDEMRLLYNIINEFKIYKGLLNPKLSQEKLLAMVVYKNICPSDFVKLNNYEGDLYDAINKKHECIKRQSDDIDKKIDEYKEEIKKLETLKIKDIKELRALYILQYLKQINNNYKVTSFFLNNANYDLEQVLDDSIFPQLVGSSTVFFNNIQQNRNQQQINFQNIENRVDSENNYTEREKQIHDFNSGKIQELKKHISLLEQRKKDLSYIKLSKLFFDKNVSIELNDNNKKLINLLLRNGYIDENYMDYISLFYEGSLSKDDHTFLLNVKSQINTDLNHNLNNIENLLKKININDFKYQYILNYKLMDFLLDNNRYDQQKEAVFSVLKNEKGLSLKFIDGYIDREIKISSFIKELYHYQINIFDLIYQNSSILDNRKILCFKLTVENVDINNLKTITQNTILPIVIADNPNGNYNIFNLISDDTKIKDLLKTFNIKINYNINPHDMSSDMLDYIYQNNHYSIKTDLLKFLIQTKGNFNPQDFDTRNYYSVKNSECDSLINYINENIINYITNVYLKIKTNTKEDEECLVELLNNEKLSKIDKIEIIQKEETIISDLEKIDTVEIENILLQYSKVKPTWKNIIGNYCNNEKELKEHILLFLNNIENAKILSKSIIEKNKLDEETFIKFLTAILLNESINTEAYELLLNSIPYYYSSLRFENLSTEKIELLVGKYNLSLNKENFDKLKGKNHSLHIRLIETRRNEIPKKLPELLLEDNDVDSLIKSPILSLDEKNNVINIYGEEKIKKNTEILDSIGQIIIDKQDCSFSKNIIKAIFEKTGKSVEYKISLLNIVINKLNQKDIKDILISFNEPYSNLTKGKESYIIPENNTTHNLLEALINGKYIKGYRKMKKGLKVTLSESAK